MIQFLTLKKKKKKRKCKEQASGAGRVSTSRDDSYYEAIANNDEDKLSTHSDCDSTSSQFSRGGRLRASLPIVRSPNKSLEKPLGLVFLVFRNETKRALLPNEVTSLDTLRALFARAFSPVVNMPWFEQTNAKVYIQDPTTNVYYELEDMRDIKDRCVVKIVENEGIYNTPLSPHLQPQNLSSGARIQQTLPPSPHVQQQARASPLVQHQSAFVNPPTGQPQALYGTLHARPQSGYESDSSARSATPHLIQPGFASDRQPREKLLPVQSGNVNQHQMSLYAVPPQWPSPRAPHDMQRYSQGPVTSGVLSKEVPDRISYHEYTEQRSSGSVTPVDDPATRERMERMEAQLASLTVMVQHAVTSRPGSAHSEISQQSKTTTESGGSDSTTPTLQSPSCETIRGLSDGPAAPMISPQMVSSLKQLYSHIQQLRADARAIKQLHISHMQSTRESVNNAFLNIKAVIEKVPGAGDHPIRVQRLSTDKQLHDFQQQANTMQNDLGDLSYAVEELRHDVLERGCRVNKEEVQTMALALGNISKNLAQLKGRFPDLQNNMKSVMAGEMEVVVKEEKLATVQEKQPVRPPQLGSDDHISADSPRTCVLSNIQAIVPDHEQRVASLQEASAARERKKKIAVRAESLRFEKCLEIAQKQLKSSDPTQSTETSADRTERLSKSADEFSANDGFGNISADDVPPQKPPRLFTSEPSEATASQNVSGHLLGPHDVSGHVTPHDVSPNQSVHADHSTSRLSTFGTDLMTSTPNGQNVTSGVTSPTVTSLASPGSIGSERTSFNADTSHVSESGLKTSTKAKKIPPPPPPRKSSRATLRSGGDKSYSPVTHETQPLSPPTYENVHKPASILKSPSRIARPVVTRRTPNEESAGSNAFNNSLLNRSDASDFAPTAQRARASSESDSDSSAHSQDTIKRATKTTTPNFPKSPLSPKAPISVKPPYSKIGVYNGKMSTTVKDSTQQKVNIQKQSGQSDFTETEIY